MITQQQLTKEQVELERQQLLERKQQVDAYVQQELKRLDELHCAFAPFQKGDLVRTYKQFKVKSEQVDCVVTQVSRGVVSLNYSHEYSYRLTRVDNGGTYDMRGIKKIELIKKGNPNTIGDESGPKQKYP